MARRCRPMMMVLGMLAAASPGWACTGSGDGPAAAGDEPPTVASAAPVVTTAPATNATAITAPTTTPPPTTTPATTTPATTTPAAGRTVLDFADERSTEGWIDVDDTVMGGVSSSSATWRDGRLRFAGTVSLENNGGFASIRSPFDPGIGRRLAGTSAVELQARGDGRTYVLQLRGNAAGGSLHVVRFATEAGVEQTHVLPVAAFVPVGFRLNPVPGPPLDPAGVVQVALYVLDGQAGPFTLDVVALRARTA